MLPIIFSILADVAMAGPAVIGRRAALPPVVKSTSAVVNAIHSFAWPLERDGGGGGTVNGTHLVNFADTSTNNQDFYNAYNFYPFVSNSIAAARSTGVQLDDFTAPDYIFAKQQWPLDSSEVAAANHRYAIWPNTNIVTGCSGLCGYTVTNVLDVTYNNLPYSEKFIYSTLSKITYDSAGPKVQRIIVSFNYAYDINYGSFALARARDGSDCIYMFAAPSDALGIKVARVNESQITDKTKYTYWNGKTWATSRPSSSDKGANLFNYSAANLGPGTGEIFYSEYYKTWVAVFFDALSANSIFRMLYSTTGAITGPWSTKVVNIYKTPCCKDVSTNCRVTYNYAAHAYPNIDPTGKTLLLGWTFNGNQTQFATVTFA